MTTIVFATGNTRKIQEATSTLEAFGISVSPVSIEIDEIQHHDPAEITKAKARAAYSVVHQPVVVQDTSWSVPALGGFPGGYMKDVSEWWDANDWITIMTRHADRTIYCHEHIAYFDGETLHHFEETYTGVIIDTPRGQGGESIEKVVSLYDNKTLAEVHDQMGIASAGATVLHWKQFGEWAKDNLTQSKEGA